MKAIILIIFLLVAFETVPAQVTQEWVARYNGPGNDFDAPNSITADSLGNVYVTGFSYDGDSGTYYDYATVKYNSAGIQQWAARYDGPGNYDDRGISIAVDGPGNVYVTGYSYSSSGSYSDYATIKYNSAGVQQWAARYNGPGNSYDYGISIVVDGSGNVFAAGGSIGSGTYSDYTIIKYNSAGVQQWVARYNGPGNGYDYAYSIAIDSPGNIYVTGRSTGSGTDYDYATIKYNSAGVEQWVARYNGPINSTDYAYSFAIDGSGNVYVTGYSAGNGTSTDYATIKYNSAGLQLWVARYNGPGNSFDQTRSIGLDGSGNIYVTGESYGIGMNNDYATIKYDSAGKQVWAARYNGPGNSEDAATSIAVDSLGNAYITGFSIGSGTEYDYATLKYNSDGVLKWAIRYNGPGNSGDFGSSIALNNSGNVYVTGSSYDSGTGTDYATIKYSLLTGIRKISPVLPEQFGLSQNYPNPFNPSTKIRFEIIRNSHTKLFVYDVLGKVVANLVDEQLQPGIYETELDGSMLTSGVYFYRIETESFTDTKKMLIVK